MSAVDDMKPYIDMQIVGVHPVTEVGGGVILELGVVGRPGVRRWVTIGGSEWAEVAVTETVDPPAPRYRNRRGYTADLAQHHIDQGDDRAERDRELTDWCDL